MSQGSTKILAEVQQGTEAVRAEFLTSQVLKVAPDYLRSFSKHTKQLFTDPRRKSFT